MCEAKELAVAGCKCDASSILDEHGNYCLARLKEIDLDWWQSLYGTEYEVLSYKMDVEDPDGAQIISIAGNLSLSIGMERTHLEIWSALENLCDPSPRSGQIEWEPVRDKLIDMYGEDANDINLVEMFKFILSAGAKGSPHLKDIQNFMQVYVNPKKRKMLTGAYGVFCQYPVEFVHLKNALLKYTWGRTPKNTWVPNPVNLYFRFDKDGKYSWFSILKEVEDAMMFTLKLGTTVVVAGKRFLVKWKAELCFSIVGVFQSFPKVDGKEHAEQLLKVRKAFAEAIAKDVLKLPPLMVDGSKRGDIPKIEGSKRDTDLISTINALVVDHAFPPLSQDKSTVVGQGVPKLTPRAIEFDDHGRAVSTFTSVHTNGNKTNSSEERLNFDTWLGQVSHNTSDLGSVRFSSRAAEAAVNALQDSINCDFPVCAKREKDAVKVLAMQDLAPGELCIPLFFRKANSVVTEKDVALGRVPLHPKAVKVTVSWLRKASEKEQAAGMEKPDVQENIQLYIQPELILPKKNPEGEIDWTGREEIHPFWLTKRVSTKDFKDVANANCELVETGVTSLFSADFKELRAANVCSTIPFTMQVKVTVPCIVNMSAIPQSREVILKIAAPKEKDKKEKKEKTAFDQIKDAEVAKKRKMSHK